MNDYSTLQPEAHHNRWFFGWAKWVVRRRGLVIIASLLVSVLSLFCIAPAEKLPASIATRVVELRLSLFGRPELMVDTSMEAFSDPENESAKVLERYRDLFGRDDFFMVLIEGDVFSIPYLQRLKRLHEELEGLDVELLSLGERRGDRVKRRQTSVSVESAKEAQSPKNISSSSAEPNQGDTEASAKGELTKDESRGGLEGLDDLNNFDDLDSFSLGDLEAEGHSNTAALGSVEHTSVEEESSRLTSASPDRGTVIEEVTSLINARRTRGSRGNMVIDKWCDPLPSAESLSQLKSEALKDSTLVGQVLGERGQHSVILLRAHFMSEDDSIRVNQKISEIAMRHHEPTQGFTVRIAGMPQLNATLKTTLLGTLKVLLIVSLFLMIGMLAYQFRHPLGVFPPLIVVGMAALNTFTMMFWLGMPVTMLSNILPAFIICVGIGDSVHLLSVYRDQYRLHEDSGRAVIETVAMTAVPVLFTSITTMVGLLSFRFASIPAIQDMGTAGAIGVGAACLHSILFLPALLTFNRGSYLGLKARSAQSGDEAKQPDWLDRFIRLISDSEAGVTREGAPRPESSAERRRRHLTLWACALLTMIALVGASKLRVWHNPLAWLPASEPTKETFEIIDREVGGTANVQLLIKGGDEGMRDLELLRGVESLKAHLLSYRHPEYGDIIGNVININDIVKETRRALYEGAPEAYQLPETREELSQLLFLFENTGPDQLRRLAANDLSSSQMTLRLKWLEATAYRGFTDHIKRGIELYIPPHAEVQPTGAVYTLVSTVGNILFDLVRSFGTALVVITLIMVLMLKGIRLGMLSMVPNLIPIIWLMGFMGFVGITIDMNNILIASIAIGLAVDDTIHLLHHFRVHYEESNDPFVAIHASLKHAGRAMVVTSSILTLGFFAYMAAEMKNIQIFGLLIGLCAALAMLIDLIFGPALLRTCYQRGSLSQAPNET